MVERRPRASGTREGRVAHQVILPTDLLQANARSTPTLVRDPPRMFKPSRARLGDHDLDTGVNRTAATTARIRIAQKRSVCVSGRNNEILLIMARPDRSTDDIAAGH